MLVYSIEESKKFSMMKVLYMLLLVTSSCSSSKQSISMEPILLEIDFQDFFKNDKISLKFNQCSVVSDIVVNSNESTGLSTVRLKVYKQGDKNYRIVYSDTSIICKRGGNNIELIVELNGGANRFLIDINAGKFIGFSKKSETGLIYNQSKTPFEYN